MSHQSRKPGVDACGVSEAVAKMWIVDVLKAPSKHPTLTNVITFQNTDLKKVNVCGVVTECRQMGLKTQFKVDDATGSIVCTLNYVGLNEQAKKTDQIEKRRGILSQMTRNTDERTVSEALSEILSFINENRPYQGEIKVGDHRIVCGFISNYFAERRINAFKLSRPLTEAEAANRMIVMARIYRSVYARSEKEDKELKQMLSEKS